MLIVRRWFFVAVTLVPFLGFRAVAQTPLGTAFTYQGQLRNNGVPADGLHDFEFRLFDAATQGNQVGSTVCLDGVDVANGLFTVALDFGGQFMTDERWLEVAVRADAIPGNCESGQFTILSPRQALTAAPFAVALPGLWTQNNATSPNIIAGFRGNTVSPGVVGATIGGGGRVGGEHTISADYATVAGGQGCEAAGVWDVVSGGLSNRVESLAEYCVIAGGGTNWIAASALGCSIGGGEANYVDAAARWSTIAGGTNNRVSGDGATVAGGAANWATASYCTIAGGGGSYGDNRAKDQYCTIGGGSGNVAGDDDPSPDTAVGATVAGGALNVATASFSTVAGGGGRRWRGQSGERLHGDCRRRPRKRGCWLHCHGTRRIS